jgi:hypothetical protein
MIDARRHPAHGHRPNNGNSTGCAERGLGVACPTVQVVGVVRNLIAPTLTRPVRTQAAHLLRRDIRSSS